ncbi:MAG: GIY-YIG nuclease family protein [Terriglobia bacterium]
MTVYLIQSGKDGPAKIGFTSGDLPKRLRELQCGSPEKLTLIEWSGCRCRRSKSEMTEPSRCRSGSRLKRASSK